MSRMAKQGCWHLYKTATRLFQEAEGPDHRAVTGDHRKVYYGEAETVATSDGATDQGFTDLVINLSGRRTAKASRG